ncbi:MAG: response regulator [Chloroflexota bacterium]
MNTDNFTESKTPLILIVDDIPKNLQVLSNILTTQNYNISFASNGAKALSVLQTIKPDLILLDIMMPELDGFEVCERIKNTAETKDIPVIFITGKAESEDIVRGLKIGAVDYITKPFNSIELLSRVKVHLDLKFSRDAIVKYNSKLKEYQEELKAVIASKDKFFSIIAHDLRSPFSGFLGLSEMLSEEFENLKQEDITQIAESMNKAAKRLFSLLENLLEWSRAQMGKLEYNPTAIRLQEAFQRNASIARIAAKEKNINIEIDVAENEIAWADSNVLNTVLRNLLSNAIKFTYNGGSVRILTQNLDDSYAVSVCDNGSGMAPEAISKLFSLETKQSTPGTNNEQGSGLGLLLCKELVEMNKGTITVQSEKGVGSIFTFTLPKFDGQSEN